MHINADLCAIEMRQTPEDSDTDSDDVYLSAIISSGKLDSHGTRMTEKTLKNFAKDLKNSIQFKDSHQYGHGFGVSTGGKYENDKVRGDFTISKGFQLRNASYPTSDEFIRAIDKKIITRVSVGFAGGTRTCSICKSDWYKANCYHWPGRKYAVTVNGKETMVRAEVEIDDAHLVEVSAVSRGSNPDAHIVKQSKRAYANGELPIEVQEQLERQYEIRFELDESLKEDNTVADEKTVEQQLEEVRAELKEAQDKIVELEPLANCGTEARKHTLGEVVEAFKVRHADTLTEDDIKDVTTRSQRLTFVQLISERNYLRKNAPAPPKVSAGAKVKQPDESGNRDVGTGTGTEEETEVRGVNPPSWNELYRTPVGGNR